MLSQNKLNGDSYINEVNFSLTAQIPSLFCPTVLDAEHGWVSQVNQGSEIASTYIGPDVTLCIYIGIFIFL